jgi:hypothetical protein
MERVLMMLRVQLTDEYLLLDGVHAPQKDGSH